MQILSTFGQTINIDWQYSYGSWAVEESYDMVLTPDSNIVIVGVGYPEAGDFFDCGEFGGFIALKMDTLGNLIWSRCYGGSGYSVAYTVINTSDGGFILTGYTYSNDGDVTGAHGNADCWVVKLDAEGNLEWEQAFGGSNFDSGTDIIELFDGNYAVVTRSSSIDGDVIDHHGAGTTTDAWIITLSPTGEMIWSKSFGGSDEDDCYGITQDPEGNLLITGNSFSADGDVPENKGSTDVWVFKINLDGDLLWSYTYGGTNTDNGNKIISYGHTCFVISETYSNNFDVSGNHGSRDAWLIKTNTDGDLLFKKCFGGSRADEFYSIEFTGENEMVFAGVSGSSDGDLTNHYGGYLLMDYWTVHTGTLGNINWQKSLGGSLRDEGRGMVKLSSSTYITTGFTYSSDYDVTENAGYSDIWTVKLSVCNALFYADADGDGFGNPLLDSVACSAPPGFVSDSTDCNDADNTLFPTAMDICNDVDDNCNGLTDEDAVFITYYADTDLDGFGDPDADSVSCTPIIDYVTNDLDCNDLDASITPVAPELCNAIDDNCNGLADEGLVIYTHYADIDLDGFGNPDAAIDTCLESLTGYVSNGLDCNDSLPTVYPGAEEVCNYLDDDCDGFIDDNLVYTWQYEDADNDLYGNVASDTLACLDVAGYVSDSTDCNDADPNIYPGAIELLNGLDDDCDGVSDEGLSVMGSQLDAVSLHPNPNHGIFILAHPSCAAARYNIYDVTGKLLLDGACTETQTRIELPQIAAGIYTCKWTCTSGDLKHYCVINFVVYEN